MTRARELVLLIRWIAISDIFDVQLLEETEGLNERAKDKFGLDWMTRRTFLLTLKKANTQRLTEYYFIRSAQKQGYNIVSPDSGNKNKLRIDCGIIQQGRSHEGGGDFKLVMIQSSHRCGLAASSPNLSESSLAGWAPVLRVRCAQPRTVWARIQPPPPPPNRALIFIQPHGAIYGLLHYMVFGACSLDVSNDTGAFPWLFSSNHLAILFNYLRYLV